MDYKSFACRRSRLLRLSNLCGMVRQRRTRRRPIGSKAAGTHCRGRDPFRRRGRPGHVSPPLASGGGAAHRHGFHDDHGKTLGEAREQLPEKPPTPAVVVPAKPLDSRFVLFGIVIKGDRKEALVSNLDRRTATEKESIWVTVGDKIGNLNVSEIHSAQIILTQGGSTYTVHLSDQNHSQRRPSMPKKIQRSETGTINITQPKVKNSAGNGSKISS